VARREAAYNRGVSLALIGSVTAFWLAATGNLGRVLIVLGLTVAAILYCDHIGQAWVMLSALAVIPILIGLIARPRKEDRL
jgi:hypothetical protein